jgi:small subunit ribosomal protein S5
VAEPTKSFPGNPRGNSPGGRGPGRGPRRARPGTTEGGEAAQDGSGGSELTEKVVFINRSAKVVKGGRRFSFSALVVAGDKHGRIGLGLGKAVEVSEAIRKGGEMAKQHMISVALQDATIPHAVFCRYGGAKVLLRPASPGTGIIAGPKVRAVLEAAGIKDILSKSLGSNNPSNVVKATMEGLQRLRTHEVIYKGRGLEVKPRKTPVIVPAYKAPPKAPPVFKAASVAPVAPAAPVVPPTPPPPAPPASEVPPPATA